MEYNIAPNQLRATAHKIADVIYQKLTGEAGIFASRIAYINKSKGRYALQVPMPMVKIRKRCCHQMSRLFRLHGRQMAARLPMCRLKRKNRLFTYSR